MNALRKTIDSIIKKQQLTEKKSALASELLQDNFSQYNWISENANYYIKKSGEIVYSESHQHVHAASKLMRIPYELWLLWANKVVDIGNTDVKKMDLSNKLPLFKEAFELTIKPYLEEEIERKKEIYHSCFNCGSSQFHQPVYKSTLGKTLSVMICALCGLGVRYPRDSKNVLSKIYEDKDYFSGNSTEKGYFDYTKEESWRREKAVKYLQQIEEFMDLAQASPRALDLGSGFGYFLLALQQKNYEALGIELAEEAVDIANNKFKTKTLKGDLHQVYSQKLIADRQFDLVTMWDVLEHLFDFNDDIGVIKKILRPHGYVALRTNNIESIEYQVFGSYFHSIKYEHTFYFTSRTLTEIFERFQIKPVKIWTHTHLFLGFMTKKEIATVNKNNKGGDIFYIGQKNE